MKANLITKNLEFPGNAYYVLRTNYLYIFRKYLDFQELLVKLLLENKFLYAQIVSK